MGEYKNRLGLPDNKDDEFIKKNLNSEKDSLKNTLIRKFFLGSGNQITDKLIKNTNQPPVNIVKVKGKGINDTKGNYFDILQYFEDNEVENGVFIEWDKVKYLVNHDFIYESTKTKILQNPHKK